MRRFLLPLMALPACGGASAAVDAQPAPLAVHVGVVEPARATEGPTYAGVVRSPEEAAAAFAVPGRITALLVESGSSVAEGQALAHLDAARYRHALDAAAGSLEELEERLAQATRELARTRELAVGGAATDEELEQRESRVDALQKAVAATTAQRDEAAWQASEAVLRAPFDGVVTDVRADVGDVVGAGVPVLGLRSVGVHEIALSLAEAHAAHLDVGATVAVQFPLADRDGVTGTVRTVGRAAQPGAGFPAVVALPDVDDLLPGLSARVTLPALDDNALTVPLAAVVSPFGTRDRVLVVRDGHVDEVPVVLGRTASDRVTVRGDLAEGDVVVVAGHIGLADGAAVEVR